VEVVHILLVVVAGAVVEDHLVIRVVQGRENDYWVERILEEDASMEHLVAAGAVVVEENGDRMEEIWDLIGDVVVVVADSFFGACFACWRLVLVETVLVGVVDQ
jgi:hypothetical protein